MAAHPDTVDLSVCLGPGVERLSLESRNTLVLSWLQRDGPDLDGRALLRGLIAFSNASEAGNIHELLKSLRPEAPFAEVAPRIDFNDEIVPPCFSAEMYRVMVVAMREAAPHRKISNLDLLIGLAECGQELLAREGITADEIRPLRALPAVVQ